MSRRWKLEPADWYTVRRARNLKPATYRCPFCGYRLHAMSPHVLVLPEGDTSRRRHAHAECAAAANLPGPPRAPGLLSRLLFAIRSRLH